MEGDVNDDAGACLSDGVEALHTQGLCPETMWPYSDDKVGLVSYRQAGNPSMPLQWMSIPTVSPSPVIPPILSEPVQGAAARTLLPGCQGQ